jgi:large subunit ribosomal protein L21
MAGYAIISLGGKQYRVREGERLLVDRVATQEGKTFHPEVLLLGGDGVFELAPQGTPVTVKVVGSALGEKVRIGKYKPKTGYRRKTGFRAKLSQIEIQTIGAKRAATPKKEAPAPKKEAPAAKKEAPAAKKEEAAEAPAKLPRGYADLTVKDIADKAKGWSAEQVAAALEYERAHANRKGAVAALEAQEKED